MLQLDVPSFWRYRDGTIDDGASDADEDSGDELGDGERESGSRKTGVGGERDAPIVLLHGLFGFGHGVGVQGWRLPAAEEWLWPLHGPQARTERDTVFTGNLGGFATVSGGFKGSRSL